MKKLLSVLPSTLQGRFRGGLLFLALLVTTTLWAYDFQSGDLYYNFTSGSTVEVTDGGYFYSGEVIIIPETVTYNGVTYSVTSIGGHAFENCYSLTSITIPNSVTSIGWGAFYNCESLTSITIPESVTSIGYSFHGCTSLTTVVWNAHNAQRVETYEGEGPFGGCPIASFTFGENVKKIPNYICSNLDLLTSVTIPNSVTSIGDYAFRYCKSLTSVTIPNSVTSIRHEAFYSCFSLTSITIPNSVTSIGDYAFSGCSGLTSIIVEGGNTIYDSRENCNAIIETATNTLIAGCQSTVIPNSVTSIGNAAFKYCSSLTSITIPNSVTSIGSSAFSDCSGLTKTNYTGDIAGWCDIKFRAIESNPMYYSHNFYINDQEIQDLVIPNTVDSIHNYVFSGCSALTSVTIPNSVTSIGVWAFHSCSALTSVTIPNSVTSIGYGAFQKCSSLTSITIPESVTSIGDNAFYGCSSLPIENNLRYADTYLVGAVDKTLSTYSIKEGTKWIGSTAFSDCSSLTSVTIPESVTSIGYSFHGCTSLTTVVWNAHNAQGGANDGPFRDCPIASFTFGEKVKHIPHLLCSGLTLLTSITIPNSVTSIGYGAFSGCYGLTSITCEAMTPPTFEADAFVDVSTSIPVYVPCGCVSAYKAASTWKNFTKIQEPQAEYSIQVSTSNSQMGTAKVDYNNCAGNQISATANFGYHFTQWSDGVTDNPRTITLTQDTVLTAEFAINQYTISTASSHKERGTTAGDTIVDYLEYVTISATANYGYHFTRWNDKNTTNPRQVQVTKDATYTATFGRNTYYITTNYNKEQGTIKHPSSALYLDVVTFTATANYGYHFVQWSDGVTDNPRTLTLTQDTVLTAEFAINQYTISTASSHKERGTTAGDTIVDYLEYVTISATANYGYHFTQWNDKNTSNPRQIQATQDQNYTAYFNKNTYSISLSCNEVQGEVEGPTYAEYLDKVTLTATANYGYHFTQWSDGVTDNPRTITLNQDTTFMAEFALTTNGKCGDNLYWLYNNNKLIVTGSGTMYDERPWGLFVDDLTEVVLPEGLTHIGGDAFTNCNNLKAITIPASVTSIGDQAFAGCRRIRDVYCYPLMPPYAEATSFANYNANLNVPCDFLEDYQYDPVFGSFKYFNCMGAESDNTDSDEVVVTPGTTDVTIVWPTEEDADTYSIVIYKDGRVFCTLTFNANGQLLNIAFAPGRDGNRPSQYAEQVANGYRFTVTGLTESTKYEYNITTKDESDNTISTHTGEFTTKSNTPTDLENTNSQSPSTNPRKLLRDNQLLILHNGKTYNVMGAEIQ